MLDSTFSILILFYFSAGQMDKKPVSDWREEALRNNHSSAIVIPREIVDSMNSTSEGRQINHSNAYVAVPIVPHPSEVAMRPGSIIGSILLEGLVAALTGAAILGARALINRVFGADQGSPADQVPETRPVAPPVTAGDEQTAHTAAADALQAAEAATQAALTAIQAAIAAGGVGPGGL